MTKLADIAEKLNLDVSVISRALSQSPENQRRVSQKTRKLIQETAKAMNYVPDRSAVFFRKKKAPTILCYLPGYTNRLIGDLVVGISEEAFRQKFPVNFFFGTENDDFNEFCTALKEIKHSGVITYPPQKMSDFMRNELVSYHQNGGHILFLNALSNGGVRDERFASVPQLEINDEYGGKLVAEYFMELGIKTFFVTDKTRAYRCRSDGFEETLSDKGLTSLDFSVEQFLAARKKHERIGVFATSDEIALNIMLGLGEYGLHAGQDYFLAGYDDKFYSSRTQPSLTTVHQPTREEGILAVKKVISMIDGERVGNELLNPWLMIRESTGGKRPDLLNPQQEEILY